MENEIETLRSRLRIEIIKTRKSLRELQMDQRRGFVIKHSANDQIPEEIAMKVLSKIRRKTAVDISDMNILRIFLSRRENISVFFKNKNALRGLVGELIGSDATKQVLAAECLCLLTLGSPANCLAIIKAAGAYLTMFLGSANMAIAEFCCLALGNIACSSPKANQISMEQGVVKAIIPYLGDLFQQMNHMAMYTLSQILAMSPDIVEPKEVDHIVCILSHMGFSNRYHTRLLFIASAHGKTLTPAFAGCKIFTKLVISLSNFGTFNDIDHLSTVVFLLRTLANLASNEDIIKSEQEVLLNEKFVEVLRRLLLCSWNSVVANVLWFLGNLENHQVLTVQWKTSYFEKFSDLLAMNLESPKLTIV